MSGILVWLRCHLAYSTSTPTPTTCRSASSRAPIPQESQFEVERWLHSRHAAAPLKEGV